MRQSAPLVIIDLEEHQKISGVSFSTAAGVADVDWPKAILIFTSDDQKTWKFAGDLVELSNRKASPPEDGAAVWVYQTEELRVSGRYIAFGIQPLAQKARFVFCDEIEVFSGDHEKDSYIEEVSGSGVDDLRKFMTREWFHASVVTRLQSDADAVARLISESSLDSPRKQELLEAMNLTGEKIRMLKRRDPAGFSTVFPLNPVHAEILSIHGRYLQAARIEPLVLSKEHRYQLNDLFPPVQRLKAATERKVEVSIDLAGDEVRHDAFIMTNATADPKEVSLRFVSKTGEMADLAPALSMSFVPWTDTLQLQPVAAALPSLPSGEGVATLPPGITTKVWISVDAKKLQAGIYHGDLEITMEGKIRSIPYRFNVSTFKTGGSRLFCGMWDYTHPTPLPGLTPDNVEQAIEIMEAHGVNVAWGRRNVLPWPKEDAFNEDHTLAKPLDFTELRKWITARSNSQKFMIYAYVGDSFAGVKMHDPAFSPRVGAWAKALADELVNLKLSSDQVTIALVDEPQTDEKDARVVAWGRAIRKTAPGLQLFQNPVWRRPDKTSNQEAITLADIICPYVIVYEEGGPAVAEYFEKRRQAGQTLWFYLCSGPTRLFDPSGYFRNLGWLAFDRNAKGIAYWAFGDIGGAPDSWNEYIARHDHYSPAFLSPDHVTGSIYLSAMHEGIQDYTLLSLLEERLAAAPVGAWKQEAQTLLSQGPSDVLKLSFKAPWTERRDPSVADQWRLKALRLLEQSE